MAAVFKLRGAGVAELLKGSDVLADLLSRGAEVAGAARSAAPVDTGRYRNSIEAESVPGRDRARVRVYARTPYAMVIEAEERVLGRALDAAR